MKSRLEFEVETLRSTLQAGADALTEIEKSRGELSHYGEGMRYAYEHVVESLDRILKEVSE